MDVFPFWFFFGFFLKRLFCFPCIFCFSAVSPRSILLDKALGESLFRSFVPHFINHHELKLRHIYQLANGGPVPACTPLHTWISLITSLALPDYSQTLPWIGLPTGLCVCVCARECFFFFFFFRGGLQIVLTLDCTPPSTFWRTHLLQFPPCPVIETVSGSDTPRSQSHQAYHCAVTVPLLRFKKSLIKDRHCAHCSES